MYYLNQKTISYIQNKVVYIYGTGIEAENAFNDIQTSIYVKGFVDNFRGGRGTALFDRPVLSFDEYSNIIDEKKVILIATYRFGSEIENQLLHSGLRKEVDFYMWDNASVFSKDSITTNYIRLLQEMWGKLSPKKSEAFIIIPFDSNHSLMSAGYSYFANYFSEKYDASIIAYPRFCMKPEDATPVQKEIYQAMNVTSLIDYVLSSEQNIRVNEICEDLWPHLYTWKDWKEVSIYNIRFGTTMIRDFLRFFMPQFDMRNEYMQKFLTRAVSMIVFWHDYFEEHNVRAVILGDGVTCDGYIRDLAIARGVPTYTLCYTMERLFPNWYADYQYQYFDRMWEQLSPDEQKYGLTWAKEHLEKRLHGSVEEVGTASQQGFTFALNASNHRVTEANDKLKIVICPHIFEEDSYWCGEHIFDDSYFEWLCHLGDLSEQTPQYDWYLKEHPDGRRKDLLIWDMLLKRYPRIKRIPAATSPYQMRDEGIKYALTVCGTIGQEYPAMGIQVINAGHNPYDCFDFTFNPKTKEDYDDLIFHLSDLPTKNDLEGLYKFYCIRYLYLKRPEDEFKELFQEFPSVQIDRSMAESMGKEMGTWLYRQFMDEWTPEKHERLKNNIGKAVKYMDEHQADVLYRKDEKLF